MSIIKVNEQTRKELNDFKHYMHEKEYTESTIIQYSTYLSRFLRQKISCENDSLRDEIFSFLEREEANNQQTFKSCRAALNLYFRKTMGLKLSKVQEPSQNPEIEKILTKFYEYSINVKHLLAATAFAEANHIRCFLEYELMIKPGFDFTELEAQDIRDYVVGYLFNLKDSSKGRIVTSLRNFFRFLLFNNISIHDSVLKLPLSPANWGKSSYPTTLSEETFSMLHTIPDTTTNLGKRDFSIILCFTDLALRCSEVALLGLDDFNWREGYVTIKNTKNRSQRMLPLSDRLGKALIEYLNIARPQTLSRIVFVRFSHMCGDPMGCSQIRGIVRRNTAKMGIEDKFCGTHIIRRTVATKIYNSGNSLKMTADLLGHESLDSTTYYAKADISGLFTVASKWPGGENNVER